MFVNMYLTLADVLNHGFKVHTVISQNRFESAFIPSHPVGVEGNLTFPDGDIYHGTFRTYTLTSGLDTSSVLIIHSKSGHAQTRASKLTLLGLLHSQTQHLLPFGQWHRARWLWHPPWMGR